VGQAVRRKKSWQQARCPVHFGGDEFLIEGTTLFQFKVGN